MAGEPDTDRSSLNRSLVERLSLLPVVIAVFVGALYTVGAVLTTGELRRANLVVRDTLPLVPLPQILGRGMSVFLKPFAGVLGIALVFVAVVLFGESVEKWIAQSPRWRRGERTRRLASVIAGVGALVLLSQPNVAVGIACGGVILLLWVFNWVHLRPALLLFAAAGVVMLLALSFYQPEPLATATIETNHEGVIRGALITAASGTWYIGQAHRNFVAILPEDVKWVRVKSGPHTRSPVFRLVLNAIGL